LDKHIKAAPSPQNKSELKSCLGSVTYYAKFIKNAALVLKPLYNLLKGNSQGDWTREIENAFQNIKKMLSSTPILDHYNPKMPFKLSVDASAFADGAVLTQVYADKIEKP